MQWVLDTGILLRLVNRADPLSTDVIRAVKLLYRQGEAVFTTPQNIAEFWNVSTRPVEARGGLGRAPNEARRCVEFFEKIGEILPESARTYSKWRELVERHQVRGVAVHDAKLVALMMVHGVTNMLTLNRSDFARYEEITAVTPEEVR